MLLKNLLLKDPPQRFTRLILPQTWEGTMNEVTPKNLWRQPFYQLTPTHNLRIPAPVLHAKMNLAPVTLALWDDAAYCVLGYVYCLTLTPILKFLFFTTLNTVTCPLWAYIFMSCTIDRTSHKYEFRITQKHLMSTSVVPEYSWIWMGFKSLQTLIGVQLYDTSCWDIAVSAA